MANQLTPDQLAALYAQFQSGNYNLNSDGYAPIGITSATEGGDRTNQLLGFGGNYSGLTPGSSYDLYDPTGQYGGQRAVENGGSVGDLLKGTVKDLGPAAALFAAMYLGGQGLGALAAGGGAAGAGLGVEVDPMMYGGTGAGTWGAGSAVGAVGGAAGVTGLPGGTEADLMYGGGADGGATLGGGAGAGTAAMSAIPSASRVASSASSLIPSGVSSLLGPAASILGAVAGSQGQKQTTTQTRDIPEWLKPYVTGQGGLLDSSNSLMRQQMSAVPQQAQQISNTGMGLLSQPIAGNGVAQFNQRPRFGGY